MVEGGGVATGRQYNTLTHVKWVLIWTKICKHFVKICKYFVTWFDLGRFWTRLRLNVRPRICRKYWKNMDFSSFSSSRHMEEPSVWLYSVSKPMQGLPWWFFQKAITSWGVWRWEGVRSLGSKGLSDLDQLNQSNGRNTVHQMVSILVHGTGVCWIDRLENGTQEIKFPWNVGGKLG